ncbi:MAG: heat-inducible transcriptional repressor HrcA [Alphaproteobacteria bacterium]|nr:MAG: heat-inducible transcriptional repressor HrcA [Alphaproteobacteria bacterium]
MDIRELNQRGQDIFRHIVETYLETGEPVGSRTVSRQPGIALSPASVRNVMQDLEELGLLSSPHTSAGRVPTEFGLRLFVDAMLQVGDLADDARRELESRCRIEGRRAEDVLSEAVGALSGLAQGAGMVLVPKSDVAIKQIEFVLLGPDRALAILVGADDSVENRILSLPAGMPPAALTQAANYLNARMAGRTLAEARAVVENEIAAHKAEIDALAAQVVESGLATWAGPAEDAQLIVRGHAQLLEDVNALEDLERVRRLFNDLDSKRDLIRLLDIARAADGVRIFIGAENNLFSLSGSSIIARPYMNGQERVIGVIGVIGPTRMNYARVVPMVDYTARLLSERLKTG